MQRRSNVLIELNQHTTGQAPLHGAVGVDGLIRREPRAAARRGVHDALPRQLSEQR
jgi:hypothetical protein